jgi:hypothetical protein
MTQPEINLLLNHLSSVLDRICNVTEENRNSPLLNDSLDIFKVIQKIGGRARELHPIVNQIALKEVKDPGYSGLIFWENSLIKAAAKTAASFEQTEGVGKPKGSNAKYKDPCQ